MKRLVLLLVAVAALLAAAAGCGGGGDGDRLSKEDYSTRVATVGDTLEASFSEVVSQSGALAGGDISSLGDVESALGDLSDVLRGAQDSLEGAADDLDGLSPPEDAEAAHDKLVEGLRLLATEFGTLADTVDSGDLAELEKAAAAFQAIDQSEAFKVLQEATDELQEKGYDIQGESG